MAKKKNDDDTTNKIMWVAGTAAVTAFAMSSSMSPERADCPGKIICPDTGELICKDQCPNATAEVEATVPTCCRSRE